MSARAWLCVVLGVAALTVGFGLTSAPRAQLLPWLLLFAVSAGLLAWAGRLLLAREPGRGAADRAALVGAAIVGAACLVPPVSLSDDVERYAWDGQVVASGRSPYASRPRALVGADPFLDQARLERLNSPGYYTVYPPLAQAVFALGALGERVGGLATTRGIRGLFLLSTLLAIALLLRLARRLEVPPGWALAVAWNPLLLWELVAGGHTEALMLPPLIAAALATLDERAAEAGVLLGIAASAKLTALLFAPLLAAHLFRRVRWRALWLGISPLVVAAAFAPFASADLVPHLRESLSLFTGEFSFNAPIYYAARDGLGYVHGLTPPVDHQLGPALQLLALGWLGAVAWAQPTEPRGLMRGLAYGYVGYLLLSRVLHPWYVLPALAFGVLGRSRALLALSLLLPLSYLRYALGEEAPWVLALEFAPFFALAAAELTEDRASPAPDLSR